MPRGIYERKPRKPKTSSETVKPIKVKKTRAAKVAKVKTPKVVKADKIKKVKEPKIKKQKEVKTKIQVSEIPAMPVQVSRGWLKPLPLPEGIELVEINDIEPQLRASVSVFHEEGVNQFARMMFRKYGINKFTKATYKGGKYYFFYEEPLLVRRK